MIARPKTRLYVSSDLGAGLVFRLGREQAHYLATVLRLVPGDPISLFNGRDGEWLARIGSLGRSSATADLVEQSRPQRPELDLWLLFAPIKRARIDFLVEKATELGVSELRPVITERTVPERVNLDRLRAHTIEAAEQTERLTVPLLHPPQKLERAIAIWPEDRRLLLCDETGTAPPIAPVLAQERRGPWAILVGPEGGFSQRELDGLRELAFVSPVGLGPRVLRADTAALAALAAFQALIGDWRGRSRGS